MRAYTNHRFLKLPDIQIPTLLLQGKDLMSVLYEDWHEAGEDWTKANIYLQVTSKEKQQRYGVREWLTRAQMEQKFGMEGAEAIILRKLEDEKLRKTEVRMHPEAPTCEGLMQFLTLNMEKEVDSTETCVNRLYEAAEQADSDSSSSNSDDEVSSSSSSSAPKKKGKKSKGKKEKKKGKGGKDKAQHVAQKYGHAQQISMYMFFEQYTMHAW